ncbi:MAG: DUF1643 domain-containing protein [Symploca sp. SIO2D2]|nr:DUF1643 domain-containing protein [Symploca sp. SIO2D2]
MWFYQSHPSNKKDAIVLMLNPGSLSGSGDKIKTDTTLRILREIFQNTGYNPYILNLFDLSTPKPKDLFSRWTDRDSSSDLFKYADLSRFSCVMYAYGNYERTSIHRDDIKQRILEWRQHLQSISTLNLKTNASGTPMHPMSIQIRKLKPLFREQIAKGPIKRT